MSHYHKTGEDPSDRPSDPRDENYASPSHYADTGEHTKQPHPNSNYADISEGSIRLDWWLNGFKSSSKIDFPPTESLKNC